MRIIYYDAGEHIEKLLSDEIVYPLRQISDFEVFSGSPQTNEEAMERLQGADGILFGRHLPNEVINQSKKLKVMSFVGFGVKNYIDIGYIRQKGIQITNTPGYGDNSVAEHALALLLSLTKQIVKSHNQMQKGIWDQSSYSMELKGKTIGLVGMGGIGGRMAKLCKAVGMNVISWTFNPDQMRSKELGIRFVELDELFRTSDFVSIHLPYTDQTIGLIGSKELSKMKQGSLFINTARSEIVETNALLECLLTGKIAGAGLDVFDNEPISDDNPFIKMENVIMTPHIAFNTPDSVTNMLKIAVQNTVDYFNGTPKNIV